MNDNDKKVELYTCKLDTTVQEGTAVLAVTISAQRGTVEDINTALNRLAQLLREF